MKGDESASSDGEETEEKVITFEFEECQDEWHLNHSDNVGK